MVVKKSGGRGKAKTLRVKKETLRDLDGKGKGKNVKGGVRIATDSCQILCTMGCTPPTIIKRG